jgi:hypothetical protein
VPSRARRRRRPLLHSDLCAALDLHQLLLPHCLLRCQLRCQCGVLLLLLPLLINLPWRHELLLTLR